jgi:hypothetical protein
MELFRANGTTAPAMESKIRNMSMVIGLAKLENVT